VTNAAAALAILGGGASSAGVATSPAASIAALKRARESGAEDRGVAAALKDPQLQRTLSRFRDAVSRAGSVDEALRDPRVLAVVLPAMGLSGEEGKPALAARALASDPADRKSLVNRLGDARWKEAAASLDLFRRGLDALRDPKLQETLSKGLARSQWLQGLDRSAPGVSKAMYFLDNAAGVDDAYDVLGNAVLRSVVTGALGLPEAMAIQPVETQARAVTARLDLADLADGARARKIAERYLLNAASASGGTSSPLLSLFG